VFLFVVAPFFSMLNFINASLFLSTCLLSGFFLYSFLNYKTNSLLLYFITIIFFCIVYEFIFVDSEFLIFLTFILFYFILYYELGNLILRFLDSYLELTFLTSNIIRLRFLLFLRTWFCLLLISANFGWVNFTLILVFLNYFLVNFSFLFFSKTLHFFFVLNNHRFKSRILNLFSFLPFFLFKFSNFMVGHFFLKSKNKVKADYLFKSSKNFRIKSFF